MTCCNAGSCDLLLAAVVQTIKMSTFGYADACSWLQVYAELFNAAGMDVMEIHSRKSQASGSFHGPTAHLACAFDIGAGDERAHAEHEHVCKRFELTM
jgi:hypothetical protein